MGAFAAGQIVILPFPFSDLSESKFRPALLLADAGNGDWIACQITSNPYSDSRAIRLGHEDFETGGLQRVSYARPGKLFTANEALFSGIAGLLTEGVLNQVRAAVAGLIGCGTESPDQA
jgi:mRNA interferase MazF